MPTNQTKDMPNKTDKNSLNEQIVMYNNNDNVILITNHIFYFDSALWKK